MSLETFRRAMNRGLSLSKKRIYKRRILQGRKREHRLAGGPFDRAKVFLCSAGTLPIRVGNHVGMYDTGGNWVDL